MPSGSDSDYLAYVNARVPALRRTAYALCGDSHEADDLVQETLTKLYARWSRAAKADNVDAYVHTMLARVFIDSRRRGWWKVRLVGSSAPDAETAMSGSPEDRTVVRGALDRLPPRQQAVLVLRYLCDQPIREVARLLGCTEGTVKSQTSHGLARLRDLLDATATAPAVLRHRS
jgi:RNA polymerase sigma-70 factor (sigma-E family)